VGFLADERVWGGLGRLGGVAGPVSNQHGLDEHLREAAGGVHRRPDAQWAKISKRWPKYESVF